MCNTFIPRNKIKTTYVMDLFGYKIGTSHRSIWIIWIKMPKFNLRDHKLRRHLDGYLDMFKTCYWLSLELFSSPERHRVVSYSYESKPHLHLRVFPYSTHPTRVFCPLLKHQITLLPSSSIISPPSSGHLQTRRVKQVALIWSNSNTNELPTYGHNPIF